MKRICARCGDDAAHLHHVAGRSVASPVVPVCRACHDDVHAFLRGIRLDHPGGAILPGPVGSVELGLRRLAVLAEVFSECGAHVPSICLVDALVEMADHLASTGEAVI